jgi:uncharacterized membrane protein YphA (DoxX/SURF4 family)
MNYVQRLEHWGETHHPKYLDILRMAFGIFLCFKGIEFGNNTSLLAESMNGRLQFDSIINIMLMHYIIFAHIAGGGLIAVGLLTRVACIIQIPILLGALILVRWNIMQHFSEFFLALFTLILLCYFLIIGSGPWSLDRLIWENDKENTGAKE